MSEKIYGRKPVLETLRSGNRAVTRLYLLQGSRDGVVDQIEAHAKARGIPVHAETRHHMDTLAGSDKHQGVIAVAEDYAYADLQDLMDAARIRNEAPFILLLDGIEDPHNLGAILRSADAAGVHGVVIPKHRAAEVNATVVKASAGAAGHVNTVKATNLNDSIQRLKEAGVWIVGTDLEGARNFYDYDYRQPVALVIGNEGSGLRRLVKENCDELVKIPMAGKMSSLNASVAAALVLFEVARQRRWGLPPPGRGPRASAGPAAPGLERDFFRPGPDPALEAPDEGLAPGTGLNPVDAPPPPGSDKGGGFRW
jgi:23S rRNA (guanosine2251-2'-O)-methyltransferase